MLLPFKSWLLPALLLVSSPLFHLVQYDLMIQATRYHASQLSISSRSLSLNTSFLPVLLP